MSTNGSVALLRKFVRRLVSDGVPHKMSWKDWRKNEDNAAFMADCFQYERIGEMPAITELVDVFFHPEHPLIGLNYSKTAHNVLHHFPTGWTAVLKLCRGIVFDRRGSLVAFPFPKFFNYGEIAGGKLPKLPFVATLKEDGHLLIIFWYRGLLLGTTRGSFTSPTALLAAELLADYAPQWLGKLPKTITLLTEFIHPETKVHLEYGGLIELRVNGAFNIRTCKDLEYDDMAALAAKLGLPVVQAFKFDSIEQLIAETDNTVFRNIEGWVARFANGERWKFKDKGYISVMIGAKMEPTYVMNLLARDGFESKLRDLAGEVQMLGVEIKNKIMAAVSMPGTKKEHWQALYELLPEEERTDYRKALCRGFYKHLIDSGQVIPVPAVKAPKKKAIKQKVLPKT